MGRPDGDRPAGAGAVRAPRRARPVREPAARSPSTRRSSPSSPLRPELLDGVDLLIVRELTGGLYFGDRTEATGDAGRRASRVDTLPYTEAEIARVVRLAFELARGRRGQADERRQGERARDVAAVADGRRGARGRSIPDVEVDHQLVDSCAMLLVKSPAAFDVLVTENLFGDILSDEASVLAGSLGMLPSASLGERRTAHGTFGLYEPIHGSAPDIAGQDMANPIGTILSAAMLAALVARPRGRRRGDRGGGRRGARRRLPDAPTCCRPATATATRVGTRAMTEAIVDRIAITGAARATAAAQASRPPTDDPRGASTPMTDRPVVLYDTTLRDGTQGENITLSLADKLRDRPDARRVRHALHRGRLAGLEPEGRRVLQGRPDDDLADTRSWPPSARPATASNRPEDDPNLRELVAAETPVVTIFGKSWLLHVDRGPRARRRTRTST